MRQVHIRPAVKKDSVDIARLFLISSDGLAEYIWSQVAEPRETLAEAGARRYAREGAAFSYEKCLIAELEGATVGMAHSFAMVEDPGVEPEADLILRPYSELEDNGSLYLSGIAVAEQCRNAGIGAAMMEAVNHRANDLSIPRISLICFERNEGAMRLYLRRGFQELDRRAVVPHPALHNSDGDAVLIAKSLK